MKRIITLCLLIINNSFCLAQENGFPFGKALFSELQMAQYEKDTSASAVVLNEFGEARIDNANEHNLIYEYHCKIKILKREGIDEANFIIPLYKSNNAKEIINSIKAASYNIVDNRITEVLVDQKNFFTETVSKDVDLKKFTIPNVQVGTVIEVFYQLETPFYHRNFRSWEFQSDLPKVHSEYWVNIPGNYSYNIRLIGFLQLSKNESKIIKDGFDIGGGYKADCAQVQFAMKDIPSFIEEDYMTAKSNFLSTISFELIEFKSFSGGVNKITTEWKDADMEMKKDPRFGAQLKKGKDIEQKIKPLITGVADPLEKAKHIYNFIRDWYRWNRYYGKYSDLGIKKAFDQKTGNTGDINLSLIAALKYADLDVEPLALSTRDNGIPTELYPVLNDFNYVIAKLNIGDKVYLLDASTPYLPFGLLPERCLNGKGRVFGDNPSYWYEIKYPAKEKTTRMINLALQEDGFIKGTIQNIYSGYDAYYQRKKIYSFDNMEEYLNSVEKNILSSKITQHQYIGLEDIEAPITETLTIEIDASEYLNGNTLLFNPFLLGKIDKNPFRSPNRLYPVDFGTPIEETIIFSLTVPPTFKIDEVPQKSALALPNAGGKLLYDVTSAENKITMNYQFAITKPIFSSTEYHFLKEIYSRTIQAQSSDIVLIRK